MKRHRVMGAKVVRKVVFDASWDKIMSKHMAMHKSAQSSGNTSNSNERTEEAQDSEAKTGAGQDSEVGAAKTGDIVPQCVYRYLLPASGAALCRSCVRWRPDRLHLHHDHNFLAAAPAAQAA